ncbi:hypothetical protein L227DRAFT_353751 [Lentinus tigrinus ALCF2SS1-6]|uniref:Uncharacterized protein n=1 Tax=Lentinus tigrinus ALCF2SS1-6 TaxID=1328759 RepID=A0A5C2RT43_9APHY|nr:hypothetical protein L227DRAFT_353751 [Lentinus tigrinus ALCF2SS1-6]
MIPLDRPYPWSARSHLKIHLRIKCSEGASVAIEIRDLRKLSKDHLLQLVMDPAILLCRSKSGCRAPMATSWALRRPRDDRNWVVYHVPEETSETLSSIAPRRTVTTPTKKPNRLLAVVTQSTIQPGAAVYPRAHTPQSEDQPSRTISQRSQKLRIRYASKTEVARATSGDYMLHISTCGAHTWRDDVPRTSLHSAAVLFATVGHLATLLIDRTVTKDDAPRYCALLRLCCHSSSVATPVGLGPTGSSTRKVQTKRMRLAVMMGKREGDKCMRPPQFRLIYCHRWRWLRRRS